MQEVVAIEAYASKFMPEKRLRLLQELCLNHHAFNANKEYSFKKDFYSTLHVAIFIRFI